MSTMEHTATVDFENAWLNKPWHAKCTCGTEGRFQVNPETALASNSLAVAWAQDHLGRAGGGKLIVIPKGQNAGIPAAPALSADENAKNLAAIKAAQSGAPIVAPSAPSEAISKEENDATLAKIKAAQEKKA